MISAQTAHSDMTTTGDIDLSTRHVKWFLHGMGIEGIPE